MIPLSKQWREKREALNMVPVRMREQNGCRNWPVRIRDHLVTQQSRACAAIQHHVIAGIGGQLNTGCVTAEMIGARAGRRYRSSCTPEAQTHSGCRTTV